jgi:hypothetical protein
MITIILRVTKIKVIQIITLSINAIIVENDNNNITHGVNEKMDDFRIDNNISYNNNNNNKSTSPIALSIPKPKSLISKLLTLSKTLGLIKKSNTLEEAIQLSDDMKQYFLFSGEVFICNGYFSRDKIFEEIKPNL